MIRYRTGIDRRTGRPLRGFPHVCQSAEVIIHTMLTERFMLLDFGFEGVRRIGRNLTAPVVLQFYRDLRKAMRAWEPEYDITRFQLAQADRVGLLALATSGTYYPEGRFGIFEYAEPVAHVFTLTGLEGQPRIGVAA